jgi:hypothetical protein
MKIKSSSTKTLATLVGLGVFAVSCGSKLEKNKEGSNSEQVDPVDNNGSSPGSVLKADSEETALTADHLDEAADSLGDGESGGTALPLDGKGPFKNAGQCIANPDGTVLLERDYAHSLEASMSRFQKSRSLSASVEFNFDLVWKKEGTTLACHSSGKHALIDWNDSALISGLQGDITFSRKMEREMSNGVQSLKHSFEASGKRNIKFISQENKPDSTDIVRVKEVTSDVIRKGSRDHIVKGEIKSKSMEHSVKIEAAAPLKVKVTRDSASRAWKEKLIESGIVKSELVGVRKVSTEFSNLLFKKSSESCTPVSGKLTSTVSDSAGVFKHKLIVEFKETEGVSSATLSKCLMVDGAEKCSEPADFPEAQVRGCSLESE